MSRRLKHLVAGQVVESLRQRWSQSNADVPYGDQPAGRHGATPSIRPTCDISNDVDRLLFERTTRAAGFRDGSE